MYSYIRPGVLNSIGFHLLFPVTIMDSGFSNRGKKYQTSMLEVQALFTYDVYSK